MYESVGRLSDRLFGGRGSGVPYMVAVENRYLFLKM
jgi:hypothetical protein